MGWGSQRSLKRPILHVRPTARYPRGRCQRPPKERAQYLPARGLRSIPFTTPRYLPHLYLTGASPPREAQTPSTALANP